MKLPERNANHIIETQSIKIFKSIIPPQWIIREVTERDYGVDCYVEISQKGLITGKMLAIQLKGTTKDLSNKKSITCSKILPSTINYWNKLPVPVVLVYIDVNNELVYYENIKEYIRKNYLKFEKEEINSITFQLGNILNDKNFHFLDEIYVRENNRKHFENTLINLLTNFDRIISLFEN